MSTDTSVPYGIRLARHAAAGLSHVRNPIRRDASRTSDFVKPAATRGNSAPATAAAAWPGRWSPRSSTLTPSTTVAFDAAAIGPTTSISSALQWKQRSLSFTRYAARSISCVTTGVHTRPHSEASARQSDSSSPASDGDTAVTACARSAPNVRCATAARNAESAPPLKATTTLPKRRNSCSRSETSDSIRGMDRVCHAQRRPTQRDPQSSRTTTRRILFEIRAVLSARGRGGTRRVAAGAGSHPDSETPQTHPLLRRPSGHVRVGRARVARTGAAREPDRGCGVRHQRVRRRRAPSADGHTIRPVRMRACRRVHDPRDRRRAVQHPRHDRRRRRDDHDHERRRRRLHHRLPVGPARPDHLDREPAGRLRPRQLGDRERRRRWRDRPAEHAPHRHCRRSDRRRHGCLRTRQQLPCRKVRPGRAHSHLGFTHAGRARHRRRARYQHQPSAAGGRGHRCDGDRDQRHDRRWPANRVPQRPASRSGIDDDVVHEPRRERTRPGCSGHRPRVAGRLRDHDHGRWTRDRRPRRVVHRTVGERLRQRAVRGNRADPPRRLPIQRAAPVAERDARSSRSRSPQPPSPPT